MFGRYDHSVDDKGRIFVPAKLRQELGTAFYVTLGADHCLTVYTEAAWERIMEKYEDLPVSQASKMRLLLANASKCEPDKQGRFLLPASLLQYAGIEKNITFLGQGSRAEIWNTAIYAEMEAAQLTPDYIRQTMEELNF